MRYVQLAMSLHPRTFDEEGLISIKAATQQLRLSYMFLFFFFFFLRVSCKLRPIWPFKEHQCDLFAVLRLVLREAQKMEVNWFRASESGAACSYHVRAIVVIFLVELPALLGKTARPSRRWELAPPPRSLQAESAKTCFSRRMVRTGEENTGGIPRASQKGRRWKAPTRKSRGEMWICDPRINRLDCLGFPHQQVKNHLFYSS